MHKDPNFFWQKLKDFSNQIACIDTESGQSVSYSKLEADANRIAEKLRLSEKGLVFLFTSNKYNCIAAYLGSLKSGNAVLLLDEKLNDEIRNNLIELYNPEFIITTSESHPKDFLLDSKNISLNFFRP